MSDDGAVDDTRRYLLQTVGGALTAGLAGCSTDSNGNSEPTPTETEEPTPTPTTTPEPEAEHADVTEMAHNWVQEQPTDSKGEFNAVTFNAYSPQQWSDEYGVVLPGSGGVNDPRIFDRFSYSREEVPETFRQKFYAGDNLTLRVDQLPGGTSEEDVAKSLEESGYKHDGTVNGFDIYFSPIKGSVHALGKDRHAFTFDYSSSDTTTEVLRDTLETSLNSYGKDIFTEDMKAAEETLGVQDTFGMMVSDNLPDDYISGLEEKYQPNLGASTVDVEKKMLKSAWVFNRSKDAALVQNYLENGNIGGGYQTVNRDGRVLTALGKDDIAIEDAKNGDAIMGWPRI